MTDRWLRLSDLQSYLHCGRNLALRIGVDSGALRKIGRINLYDRLLIDSYVERQATKEGCN